MTVGVELATLDNQRIKVKYRLESDHEVTLETEGTVIAASPIAILLKPRGAMIAEMIPADDILAIEILQNPNAKLIIRKLRLLKPHEVRQHLIDRHGLEYSTIESLNDIEAYEYHANIDHSNLGHVHEDKKVTARVKSIAEQAIEEVEGEDTAE